MLMNSSRNSLNSLYSQKVALNPQFGSRNYKLWDLTAALTASSVSHKISGGGDQQLLNKPVQIAVS